MLNHKGTKTLFTKRLVLRKFIDGDADAMFKNWCSDERVAKFTTWNVHNSLVDTKIFLQFLLNQNNNENSYNWAIEMDGKLIGNISVCEVNEYTDSCGIAYCLSYNYWENGIMTEACKAVVEFLFNEINCKKVFAIYDSDDVVSGLVMKKVGMKHEKTLKEHVVRKDGSRGDAELYSIQKKDCGAK